MYHILKKFLSLVFFGNNSCRTEMQRHFNNLVHFTSDCSDFCTIQILLLTIYLLINFTNDFSYYKASPGFQKVQTSSHPKDSRNEDITTSGLQVSQTTTEVVAAAVMVVTVDHSLQNIKHTHTHTTYIHSMPHQLKVTAVPQSKSDHD